MRSLISTLLASLGLFATGVRAGECPTGKVLAQPSEQVLAGFDVKQDTIPGVIERLGKPLKSKYVRSLDDSGGPGFVKHKWTRGQTAIGVSGKDASIQILQVSNENGDGALTTGRGLHLGDDLARVEALYGATFVEGRVTGPEIGVKTITYCYDDGTELSVGLNDADRVTSIRITAAKGERRL